MAYNYLDESLRLTLIEETQVQENTDRKAISLGQFEIYSDRIKTQIEKYLEGMYSKKTVQEMPIVSTINLAKRIVNQEAAIYDKPPVRIFEGVTEEQKKQLEELYKKLNVNGVFQKANRMFKLQDQTHIQVTIVNRKLKAKVYMGHQLDVVPSPFDPEEADAYLINGFDRSLYAPRVTAETDNQNQIIADADDYKANLKRIALWSKEFNFIMDDKGKILSEDTANPIGIIPFVEISRLKDNEYWFRTGAPTTDFTIQFGAALSDLGMIVRMQGFGQAWVKGAAGMIPEKIQLGPNYIIKLPVDPNNQVQTDFGFSNPSPDISGSIQYVEMVLSSFLTSRGMDPSVVNGQGKAEKYTSGLDRLLGMIDDFKPSADDFSLFEKAEADFFEILKAYINTYGGSDLLPDVKIGTIPAEAKVSVVFSGPELVLTEAEKIDLATKKVESGFFTQVEAIMEVRGVNREQAEKIARENAALFEPEETEEPAEDVDGE